MSKNFKLEVIKGGVTAPRDFVAAGIHCGIKDPERAERDLALVYSRRPATSAGVFTTNRIKAAPVRLSAAHLKLGAAQGIVANSGNANACTGLRGMKDARRMAAAAAAILDTKPSCFFVCSTGRIGVPLPIEKIEQAMPRLVSKLSEQGGRHAAQAIMTSDTRPKECAVEFEIGGSRVRIGAMAKGAGMIDPHMATMLAFLTTDAQIGRADLKKALSQSVDASFNRISVDGDMSTNDTVLCLANSASDAPRITSGSEAFERFQAALEQVCLDLAKKIVRDGECVTKFVDLEVRGAATYQDARKAARAISNSLLVKCSWHGGDPNWGRIMDALGYSGARIREESVDIHFGGLATVRGGVAAKTPPRLLKKVMAAPELTIVVNLHRGDASYKMFTTDLSPAYVKFNMGE